MWDCIDHVGSGEAEKEHHHARHLCLLQPKPFFFLMLDAPWMLRGRVPPSPELLGLWPAGVQYTRGQWAAKMPGPIPSSTVPAWGRGTSCSALHCATFWGQRDLARLCFPSHTGHCCLPVPTAPPIRLHAAETWCHTYLEEEATILMSPIWETNKIC